MEKKEIVLTKTCKGKMIFDVQELCKQTFDIVMPLLIKDMLKHTTKKR